MSREVEIEDVPIADLTLFRRICEENGLVWQERTGDIVARITDMNEGGPTYRRHMDIVKRGNTHHILTDNDVRYSSIAKRFGVNAGSLVRDYTVAFLRNKYRRMGAHVQVKVRSDQWVEIVGRVANG